MEGLKKEEVRRRRGESRQGNALRLKILQVYIAYITKEARGVK